MNELACADISRSRIVSTTNATAEPDDREVDDRADRLRAPHRLAPVLGDRGRGQQQRPADEHRPAVEHDRVERAGAALDRDVAERGAERRQHDRDRAGRGALVVAELEALHERERQPAERERDAREHARPQRLVVQQERRRGSRCRAASRRTAPRSARTGCTARPSRRGRNRTRTAAGRGSARAGGRCSAAAAAAPRSRAAARPRARSARRRRAARARPRARS